MSRRRGVLLGLAVVVGGSVLRAFGADGTPGTTEPHRDRGDEAIERVTQRVLASAQAGQERLVAALREMLEKESQQLAALNQSLSRVEAAVSPRYGVDPEAKEPRPSEPRDSGPFTVGRSYLVQRAGWNSVERFRVVSILPNGWLRVAYSPGPEAGPLARKEAVYINPVHLVLVAMDE